MAKPERPSLAAFAAATPRRPTRCSVCLLPMRAELDQAKLTGTATVPQMIAWLAEVHGVEMTKPKLDAHFQTRHHLR